MQEICLVHQLERVEQRQGDHLELGLRGRPAETDEPILEAAALLTLGAEDHVGHAGAVPLDERQPAREQE